MNAMVDELRVRDVDTVPDDLDRTQRCRVLTKTIPVILCQTVFDGDDVVLLDPGLVEGSHLGTGLLPLTGFREVVGPILIKRTGCRVQCDGDVLARHVARRIDGLDDDFASFVIALRLGAKPPSSPTLVVQSRSCRIL